MARIYFQGIWAIFEELWTLKTNGLPYLDLNKMEWRSIHLHHYGDGKEYPSCSKPSQINLDRNSGQCGLHKVYMVIKDIGLNYVWKYVEQQEA